MTSTVDAQVPPHPEQLFMAQDVPLDVRERVCAWYRAKRWKIVSVTVIMLTGGDLHMQVIFPDRKRRHRNYTVSGPPEDAPEKLERRAHAFRAFTNGERVEGAPVK